MNICYWNIHKNSESQNEEFNKLLLNLLLEKSVDLFCISEFDRFNDKILLDNNYELVDKANCEKVKCYKKNDSDFIQTRIADRYAFIESKNKKILIVCLHSYDAIYNSDDKRLLCMEEIKREIDGVLNNDKKISVFVIGDYNCMPYDHTIVNEDIFNCVLYRDLLHTRENTKERYYNPMLLLLSEKEKNYGSFYSDGIKDKNLRWYLLDQVMLNRNADEIINYESVKIITEVCGVNLLKNNKPDSVNYSDHLPLFFEIKEN